MKILTEPVGSIPRPAYLLDAMGAYAQQQIDKKELTAILRTGHNLAVYSGALTTDALTTEMLKQRRYSLFYEGHRWIDMRRYNLLNTLPIDRPGDDVWDKFPLPVTEQ